MSDTSVCYHHVHFYTKSLQSLDHYKSLEARFNSYLEDLSLQCEDVELGKKAWNKFGETPVYSSQKQDLVEQLITGLGWRITQSYSGSESSSVLVTSPDSTGARFLISAPNSKATDAKRQKTEEKFGHFEGSNLDRFFNSHSDHEGCAVLGFQVKPGECLKIKASYSTKHPALMKGLRTYDAEDGSLFHVLEVYAYYSSTNQAQADHGTVLRFVEPLGSWTTTLLPGMTKVEARFVLGPEASAFFDHWVSNTFDRKQFLKTLEDCLGFTPKVDFNAGVVAAGEAIIESTVTGNNTNAMLNSPEESLVNQDQVYLPINNALSKVGHVALYLEQLGQGIQHLASRVKDIVGFVARANFARETTGQGFSFLNIPMSYYGRLTVAALTETGLDDSQAKMLMHALQKSNLVGKAGIVKNDITDAEISELQGDLGSSAKAFQDHLPLIIKAIRKGIYSNLYSLLKDHLDEDQYLRIVRNKILVDIQGKDVLYQIFTAPVLQSDPKDEAPFLEFIQRVCSNQKDEDGNPKPVKPGCGGFGIRNFLTLFLSIEVSKAMVEYETAIKDDDAKSASWADRKVVAFTNQLNESNPVLTVISDAMTKEADLLLVLAKETNQEKRNELQAAIDASKKIKEQGNQDLQEISTRYKALLCKLREESQ